MSKKKIIIFGATGNTGSYLVQYLLEFLDLNLYEIVALSRNASSFSRKQEGVIYLDIDITNKDSFDTIPNANIYAVVNLAGAMPATMKEREWGKYIDVNITGTLNILEFCLKNNVDRIIYPTTEADLKGYWDKELVLNSDMESKYELSGNYAPYIISKCAAVDLIKTYQNNYGLKAFIFRLPTIYLYKDNPYYYVDFEKKKLGYRILIDKAINGEDIEAWGDLERQKDIVYVKDYCQLIYKAIIADNNGGIYNVGTGRGITLKEQLEVMVDVFSSDGKKSKIVNKPDKPNSRQFIMDLEKAKRELGYNPEYSYRDYLKDFKKEMEKAKDGN